MDCQSRKAIRGMKRHGSRHLSFEGRDACCLFPLVSYPVKLKRAHLVSSERSRKNEHRLCLFGFGRS